MSEQLKDAKAREKAEKAYAKAQRPWFKKKRFWALGLIALIILVSLVNGAGDDEAPAASQSSADQSADDSTQADSGDDGAVEAENANAEEDAEADNADEEAAEEEPAEAPLDVTAQKLIEDLEGNALKASNEYKGKLVSVTGTVGTIDASGDYFTIEGTEDFSLTNVQVFIDESHLDTVSEFTEGQDVTVVGTVSDVGEILGYSIDADTVD